jgi:hypothetical protein
MALSKSRLPRKLAVIGIVIGFSLQGAWWYVYKYDPFHLPTLQQAQNMGNFSAPPLMTALEDLTFVLCPGSLLHVFTMDMGETITSLTWTVAALLNGALYYAIGLGAVALVRRGRRESAPSVL